MAAYQPAAGPSRGYGFGLGPGMSMPMQMPPAAAPLAMPQPQVQAGLPARSGSLPALPPAVRQDWDAPLPPLPGAGAANGYGNATGNNGPPPNGQPSRGASMGADGPAMSMPQPSVGVQRTDSLVSDDGRRNPLVDLIDTERVYVEQLGLIIRRVAGAWSRKDFPPPKLDAMFRCVEAVYRANRAFGTKLKEIGPSPSSPKALGDLLMRWIDDLEPAYHRYTVTYLSGFDSYAPVTSNPFLPPILSEITASTPPPPPLDAWSLDALFLLPYSRLRYYRKLYARLLRSTKEGRSDHRLLLGANQKLEGLVDAVERRLEMDVAEDDSESTGEPSRAQSWADDKERISRTSSAMDNSSVESATDFSPFNSRVEDARNSGGSVATSMTHSPQRRPVITTSSAEATSGLSSVTPPLTDLELRIDPERTLDLFTMQPKKCKLQMNPPALPFTRFLRSSHDVTIFFTPTSTGQQVTHRRAHVFILSDLFLVADRMEASAKAAKAQQVAREQPERVGEGGPMPEMWLSYPPLAGKHLAVAEGQQANVLTVTVMRKETFVIHAESEMERDQIIKALVECIDFASAVAARKVTPGTSALPSPIVDPRSPCALSDTRSTESTFPPLRYPSPFSPISSPGASPNPSEPSGFPPNPLQGKALANQMGQLALGPGDTINWPRGPSSPPKQIPGVGLSAPSKPGGPPQMAVLPPRGASLRARQPSLPVPGQQPVPPFAPFPHANASHHSLPHTLSEPMTPGAPLPRSASGRSPGPHAALPNQLGAPAGDLGAALPRIPQIRTGAASAHSDLGHGHPSHVMPHLPPLRSRSAEPLRPIDPPSARFSSFPNREPTPPPADPDSPPLSPADQEDNTTLTGPTTISAQMKCKVFLQQGHGQWKALGAGKLKLYVEKGARNVKQLVVEADGGGGAAKNMLISTIVLTDGVERVAKTGVAVEISDRGRRTGIIYMIQLRNEASAGGLFESLLAGSDRALKR
ncbi:hypothetical protein Q5752_000063 [Cryptotrichosporon argae]